MNRHEWFELRSGGDMPQFMLMLPRANWEAVDIGAVSPACRWTRPDLSQRDKSHHY